MMLCLACEKVVSGPYRLPGNCPDCERIREAVNAERQRCADICERCFHTNESAAVARNDILAWVPQ